MKQKRIKTQTHSSYNLFGSKPPIFNSFFWQKIFPPGALTLLATAFYYPSLWYPFQFDDLANITKNFSIRFMTLSNTFMTSSRWVGNFFNAISFQLGRFDPFYYRILNVGIHLVAGITLFYFIHYLCSKTKKRPFLKEHALTISTLTSALFLLHPVQTQTVSYVIQARLEGLASLFIIGGLFAFAAALRSTSHVKKGLFFGLTALIGGLACGTKEIVVVMPFLAVLVDWFFIAEESWDKFKYRLAIYAAFAAFILGSLLYFLDSSFLKQVLTLSFSTSNNRGNILTNHAYDQITALPFLISPFKVVLHYLVMFVWPFNLCVEYDWVLSKGFFAADSFLPFLALSGILAFVGYSMYRKKHSYLNFGLLWFFISVAPRSSIIPSPELIVDYKTYLASAGWLFVLAVGITRLFVYCSQNISALPLFLRSRDGYMAALAVMSIGLGYGAMERNKVWESPDAFWQDIVIKAPKKARGHNNLGVALAEKGRTDEAIKCYIAAIKMDKFYTDPYNNLAVGYSIKGEPDKAIAALNQAISLFPYYPEAHNNRGSLLLRKEKYEAAEKDLKLAIKIRPHYGKAYYNLGHLYYKQNDLEKAWVHFKKATEVDLDDTAHAFHTLGQLSLKLSKRKEAIDAFEKMIATINRTLNVKNRDNLLVSTYFNLANSYYMDKQYAKSENLYMKLMSINPLDPRYAHNYGESLYTRGDIKGALKVFNKARNIPKSLPQTHFRFVSCLEKLNQVEQAVEYLKQLENVDAPGNFKKIVRAEITRLTLQDKVNKGNGSIKWSDISEAATVLSGKNQAEIKNS